MKKLFISFISLLVLLGCSTKTYETEMKDGVQYINNNIDNKNIEKKSFKIIKNIKFKDRSIHYYLHDAGEDKLAFVNYYKNKRYISIYDSKLNLINHFKIKKGSGPGELYSWLPGMNIDDKYIYFLDNGKNSAEIFDFKMNYIDSILFNSSDFRLSYGGTRIYKHDNNYIIGCVSSRSKNLFSVKINNEGKLKNYIKGLKKSKDMPFNLKNLSVITADKKGSIFSVMIGLNNKYQMRKYNKDMELVWINNINDGYQNTLSPEIHFFPNNTFELDGGRACSNLIVDKSKIYILRGVGGLNRWEWKDNSKKRKKTKIPEINNGFVDVIDKNSGKFLYRIEGNFLSTLNDYYVYKIKNHFYFVSPYNSKTSDSNQIIMTKID
ncbi:MAG TPA: hypothetical protein VKN74_00195 [Candidatus Mcinerneyibacterium sp.]|nr:hypothetical protein [Candidatus Mcinerneyibacterium sp.]